MSCLANMMGMSPQVTFLVAVVLAGMAANFAMFMVTLLRKWKLEPSGSRHKDEIARLTVNRAMRIEFVFFACQLARFVHTFYEVHAPRGVEIYRSDFWAVFERSFVTLALVALSLYDLIDRQRIAAELNRSGGRW